jgi:hypothetical protein
MEQRTLHSITAHRRALADFAALAGIIALLVSMILALAVAIVPAAEAADTPPPVAVPAPAPAPPDSARAVPAPPDSFAVTDDPRLSFQVEVGNRMYPTWKETHEARLNVEFPLGDTENSAKIVKFLPSFMIFDGKPRSESREMKNPAVRVMVYFKGAPSDSAWAFLNFPPHFSPKSFYTFQLKSIQGYPGTPAAPATAATPAEAPRPPAHSAKKNAAAPQPAPAQGAK